LTSREGSGVRCLQFVMDAAFPPMSGADLRNARNAIALSALGPVLTVNLLGEAAFPPPGIATHALDLPAGTRPWAFLKSDHPTVFEMGSELLKQIERVWDRFDPDLVLLEGVALSDILDIARRRGTKIIVDMHNLESEIVAESLKRRQLRTKLATIASTLRKVRSSVAADIRAFTEADQVWVCSRRERGALASLGRGASQAPRGTVRVIANPVPDEAAFDLPITPDRYAGAGLIFVGHLNYPPNVEAVGVLVDDLLPGLRSRGVEASLLVAGRQPKKPIRALRNRPGVTLLGDPETVTDLLGRAGYAPMPIRSGSGTRLKALEALAAGAVVCATAKAVEGLELEPGRHFLAAETAKEMADALVRGLAEPDSMAEMAGEGRRFVAERYSAQGRDAAIRLAVEVLF